MTYVSDIAFTASVKDQQTRRGSRDGYAKLAIKRDWPNTITEPLNSFLDNADSFYLATATADGQPYIQHRGGARGLLKVIDERTLAFADFSGNRQYISVGNLAENDKAYIFVMNYANRQRIKIWGRARIVENDPALLEQLVDPNYTARPERAVVFEVAAWDVNCPAHIPQKIDADVAEAAQQELLARISHLETELAHLRGTKQALEAMS